MSQEGKLHGPKAGDKGWNRKLKLSGKIQGTYVCMPTLEKNKLHILQVC